MTDPNPTEILQQIANLRQRNMLKLEEIAENMEAINILTMKLIMPKNPPPVEGVSTIRET